jgi:uncharacterized protein
MPFSTEGGWLPDVNVWIALASDRHEHHAVARQWFESLTQVACFCRVTQMALLRLLTNPKVMGEDALSPIESWAVYADLRTDERVRFIAEPDNIEETWISLMNTLKASGSVWTDAYLVAFAQEARLRLLTFDTGMRRWSSPAVEILESR